MKQTPNNNRALWKEPEDFKPVMVKEVELSLPVPELRLDNDRGEPEYQGALILVRLHGSPLGTLNLRRETSGFTSTDLAARIWAALGEKINQHLAADDLSPIEGLPLDGLRFSSPPECVVQRQHLLQNAPLISIILATRDRAQSLSASFESILALDYPEFEIILVDNAPRSTETYDFFVNSQQRLPRPEIHLRYVREDTPGLAVAHNRGLQLARGEITAFTDDDVIVDKNWLSEMLIGFRSGGNVGCVTGLVIPMELQTPAQLLFEEFGGFTKGFEPQIYDLDGHRPDSRLFPYAAGRFGTGANMAFNTNLLWKAGGFDPALGIGTPTMGADDMAGFFEAIMLGSQLVYQPGALVFHQHRRTYEGLRKQMFGYGAGLTAFLMRCMLENPKYFTEIVSKIPAGIKYTFSPDSAKNTRKSAHYPRELEIIERKGMLYGPIAYLLSSWRYRKARRIRDRQREETQAFSDNLTTTQLDEDSKAH